jgi:hypothetical protein
MRKRLRKKRRKAYMDSFRKDFGAGFDRFAMALWDVVIEGLDAPLDVLLSAPPCTVWLSNPGTPRLKPGPDENTLEGVGGGRA